MIRSCKLRRRPTRRRPAELLYCQVGPSRQSSHHSHTSFTCYPSLHSVSAANWVSAIQSALTEHGRFVFETRNPLVRAWESWTPDNAVEIVDTAGAVVRKWHEIETVDGDVVTYTSTFTSPSWDRPRVLQGRQRFLDVDSLSSFLSGAGLAIDKQFGDWERQPLIDSSPEIITIARRC